MLLETSTFSGISTNEVMATMAQKGTTKWIAELPKWMIPIKPKSVGQTHTQFSGLYPHFFYIVHFPLFMNQ